jgi:hypothetical protein
MNRRQQLVEAREILEKTQARVTAMGIELPEPEPTVKFYHRRWFQWVCVVVLFAGSSGAGILGVTTLIDTLY